MEEGGGMIGRRDDRAQEGGKRKTKRRKEECQGSGRKNDRA